MYVEFAAELQRQQEANLSGQALQASVPMFVQTAKKAISKLKPDSPDAEMFITECAMMMIEVGLTEEA